MTSEEGLLRRLPQTSPLLYAITTILVALQSSAFLLVLVPLPGMTTKGWQSGPWIGLYTIPLLGLTILTAGTLRRTCSSLSGMKDLLMVGGIVAILTSVVTTFGKVGALNTGASTYLAIWTVTTSFSLKPALDRLLGIVQPRR